uniref:Adiponectin receptor protein 1-like n=1 Tax=Phallusia mammillata TaxID=59560 RepID=A0A6F9D575_9ASCI|nr:adiponectin receptor protein 1-like [Phallusia mammillata]
MESDSSISLHSSGDESPAVQVISKNLFESGPYIRANAAPSGHNDDESSEEEGLLPRRASCPELVATYKNPLMTKRNGSDDEFDSPSAAYCPFPSPLHVPQSMQNAFEYVDHTAKEMKLHAKESLHNAIDKVDQFAHKVWDGRWRVVSFLQLQDWQKDNEFLHHWHRPPMPCFKACFGSIFRLHTETGNIWTHLIGFILFIGICIYFLCLPATYFISELQEKVVFFLFFLGAVLCLCFSTLFHTMGCHSERVFKIFGKLDYSGIALMIMGSFVPWIYYSFYCDIEPKVVYMSAVSILGVACIVISQWDKFSTAKFRGVRAILFAALGLSGVVPAVHAMVKHGFITAVTAGQLGWLVLMAILYLTGAFLYAKRIPERYFPGKCDLWFQSHQIFHILVVVAAVVHFHGISNLQQFRYNQGAQCMNTE